MNGRGRVAHNLSGMGRANIHMRWRELGTRLRCGSQGSRKRRLDNTLILGVSFNVLQDTVLFSESWGLGGDLVFPVVYDIV